jgi:enoyl-CoA hydratase/carnithine racemase
MTRLLALRGLPSDAPERVQVTVSEHVATVAFARPDKHNALDVAMFDAIAAAADAVAETDEVRAVVLHGLGRSFCSGIDLASFGSEDDTLRAMMRRDPGRRANHAQRAAIDWLELDVPVIAAVHGNCLGGGLQIALGADMRIAASDARLSIREVQWGVVPDMGITATLPRLVRIDVAKELTFTARVFSGQEAAKLGIVTAVADNPLSAALELAAEIASRSPEAVRAAKRLLDENWQVAREVGLVVESEMQLTLLESPSHAIAVAAGRAGTAPEFTDPMRLRRR